MNKFKQENQLCQTPNEEFTSSREILCIVTIIGYIKTYLCQFILSCVSLGMLKLSKSKDSSACSKEEEIFASILLFSSGCLLILGCANLVRYYLKNVLDLMGLQFWNTPFSWIVVMYIGLKTLVGSVQECVPLNILNKGVFYCVVLHAFEKLAVNSRSSQFWQRQLSSNSSCMFAFILIMSTYYSNENNQQFFVINTLNILNVSSFLLHTGLNILVYQQSKELQAQVFAASHVLTSFAYLANLPGLIQLLCKLSDTGDAGQQIQASFSAKQQYQFSVLAGYSQLFLIPVTIILSRVIQASLDSKQHNNLLNSLPLQERTSLLKRNQFDFVDEGVHNRKDFQDNEEEEDTEAQWSSVDNSQRKLSNKWKPLTPPILD